MKIRKDATVGSFQLTRLIELSVIGCRNIFLAGKNIHRRNVHGGPSVDRPSRARVRRVGSWFVQ